MAKGDHRRAENKSDEQQKLSQGYLSGVQQTLGNQAGNLNSLYFGQNAPSYGSTTGVGTTVPQYSPYGQGSFTGNGTGTQYQGGVGGFGGQQGGGQDYQGYFNSLFPGNTISSDQLWAQKDALAKQGIEVMTNGSGMHGKVRLPTGEIVDVAGGMGGGGGVGTKQWNSDHGVYGSGGGGGMPGMAMQDYSNLMGMGGDLYNNFLGLGKQIRGDYSPFLGAASNMAQTGGLSEGDKANLRARAISPIRAIYENSLRNVDRQRSLQGGYSPGYTTAMGRFNREMGQGTSDATTNAEAAIAELVQKGKLGGLGAWGSGLSGMTSGELGAMGGAGNTLGNMAGLYGTQPGMAKLFGDQALQSSAQQLQAAGLQNNLGLGLIGAQQNMAQVPGNFQSTMGNVNSVLGAVGQIGGMAAGFPSMGKFLPSMGGNNPYGGLGGTNPWYKNPTAYTYGTNY